MAAAWEERFQYPLQVANDNDSIIAALPKKFKMEDLLDLVQPENVERLLRRGLEQTGFFGARFRENAGRALLLPRSDLRRRIPLWLIREKAKKLLDVVSNYEDFPILVETWRTCLQDAFEVEALKGQLERVARGEIHTTEVLIAAPSPFAAGLIWQHTNHLMYGSDARDAGAPSRLSESLLREVAFSSQLRPDLPPDLIDGWQRKLQRTFPGYAPRDADELVDWVGERVAIPLDEWGDLLSIVERDLQEGSGAEDPLTDEDTFGDLLKSAEDRLALVKLPLPTDSSATPATEEIGQAAGAQIVCTLESVPRILAALDLEPRRVGIKSIAGESFSGSLPITANPVLLTAVIGEWLRYYGPITPAFVQDSFGLSTAAMRELLATLLDDEAIVVDYFKPGARDEGSLELCDVENLERLLRLLRARARQSIEVQGAEKLPLFLATMQGLVTKGSSPVDLQEALERLLGFPARAELWESDFFPARLDPYYPGWLDGLMQESDLLWRGSGSGKALFAFPDDLRMLGGGSIAEDPLDGEAAGLGGRVGQLFADSTARYSFEQLLAQSQLASAEVNQILWQGVWQGVVTNTTFSALRRGLLTKFQASANVPEDRSQRSPTRLPRSRFTRWKSTRPFVGDWFLLNPGEGSDPADDAIDLEELNKDRVRLLLDRYGVLFRELLARELPAFRWSTVFRSLRLMELSGEVFSGHFFKGIFGLQFASSKALRHLRDGLLVDSIFWMNAADPASPCGLGLDVYGEALPARLPSNHLVFHGSRLVMVSRRHGEALEIRVPPEHPHLPEYLEFLKVLLTRPFKPVKSIDVESINDEVAPKSPYASILTQGFSATQERQVLRLRRRY
jgi:ATP-dependent Lhr-like helicase